MGSGSGSSLEPPGRRRTRTSEAGSAVGSSVQDGQRRVVASAQTAGLSRRRVAQRVCRVGPSLCEGGLLSEAVSGQPFGWRGATNLSVCAESIGNESDQADQAISTG